MYVQTGKTFIATLIAVVISLGGLAWLSSDGKKSEPSAAAQTAALTTQSAQSATPQPPSAYDSSSSTANNEQTGGTSYEEGYRAGYRDGHQDCSTTASAQPSSGRHSYYGPHHTARRVRVAGATYYAAGAAPHRGHSTRNMILRIAAPAAIGAGIGGIAHGGKGAGIGALLGGGGGALYQLIKHPRD
jgi:hypothetical protein